jgi:hypothetical protein
MAWSVTMIGVAIVTALLVFFGAINAADYLSHRNGRGELDTIQAPADPLPAKHPAPRKASGPEAAASRPEVLSTSLGK